MGNTDIARAQSIDHFTNFENYSDDRILTLVQNEKLDINNRKIIGKAQRCQLERLYSLIIARHGFSVDNLGGKSNRILQNLFWVAIKKISCYLFCIKVFITKSAFLNNVEVNQRTLKFL